MVPVRSLIPLLLLAASCTAQDSLDAVVERARKQFQVPGVAVAVVKDGKVVLAKGYGERKLGEPLPVTDETLFGIASNTKAFTAAALAILVDEGKIAWDDPVVRHLPAFQMWDPYVTREMTVRDLLVHRSGLGLGAGDLMFWPQTNLSREEVVKRLRWIPPASSFRSRYAYDNILYLVAGQLVGAVSGSTWDEFVRDRIFAPVGMTRANTSVRDNPRTGNVATPHVLFGNELRPIRPSEFDNNAPAGGINACVADLAKWMIVQLNQGDLGEGRRLYSERQAREMWSPVTIIPAPPPSTEGHAALRHLTPNFNAYALGWGISDYRGHKTVSHTGGLAGYVSRTMLVPEIKLGVVVLTSQESRGAYDSVVYTVLDHYLRQPASDWVAAFADLQDRREKRAAETVKQAAAKRNAQSNPSLPLQAYAGRYRDPWYGDVLLEYRAGKIEIRFSHSPGLTGVLEHWQYDTFIARWRDRAMQADAYLTFSLNPEGGIAEARMRAVSPLTDFSYDFHDLLLKPVSQDAKPY